ncbi:hypothetical protein DRN74_05315 [Candidatus Micrarchaeota archaeon]|nr:MAG: hypothetical protein DRN74_05315 [Candidatus Micrarchaeota archaeon]
MNELLREVEAEKEQILATLQALREALERREKTLIELAAIATFLYNAYNGMENILKRILRYRGITLPSSESWHKDLLAVSVDLQIISFDLSKRLDEYRAFRHFMVHGYGIKLDGEKLIPLAENLPVLWRDFEAEVMQFLSGSEGKE